MAETQDDRQRDDLSDEPSTYRLEEFRRQGRVAQSRELSGMIGLLSCGVALYALAPSMGQQLASYSREILGSSFSPKFDIVASGMIKPVFFKSLKLLAWMILPVSAVGFVAGVLSSFSQAGPVFSTDPLNLDPSRLNPVSGFQKIFSQKQFFDSVRLVIRIVVMGFVSYLLIKNVVMQSPKQLLQDPLGLFSAFGDSGKVIFVSLCSVLLVFAGFDYWLQKWEFGKHVRLTKQEAKQEQKEHEGDPLLKARVRSIQREAARRRMMNAVKKADVVITNPTHIAVAIVYERDKMDAPKVIAKGADFVAQKIKQIAADAGVPTVENVPLARTLYKTVKIGHAVPRSLYQAVAEVLAYVYRLRKRNK